MKYINLFYHKSNVVMLALVSVFVITITASCEDDEKNRFNDFSKDGAFVRFEKAFPTVLGVSTLDEIQSSVITATIETPENNVVSYTLKVSASIAGTTIEPMDIGSEITSFPATLTLSLTDIASALNIEVTDIGFGDTFSFSGTATNDKGIVYTSERLDFDTDTNTASGGNNTDDLLDEVGYRNAFEFGFAIPCPQETGDFVGDWVFDMADSFGDGWDGAFVTVDIDGVTTDYTVDGGFGQMHTVTIPSGTQRLVISYTRGSFEEEHTYTVTKPDGTVLGPFGPNPALCIN